MTRKNDTSRASAPAAQRRTWKAPRMRRLATSAAEFSGSNQVDNEGLS